MGRQQSASSRVSAGLSSVARSEREACDSRSRLGRARASGAACAGGRRGAKALRRAKESSEFAIPSLALVEHNGGGIADADPRVAGDAAADRREATAWAAELGAEGILIPFFSRSELVSEDDVDRAVSAFRRLCPGAGEKGVELWYEGTLPAERVRSLCGSVDSRAFGCYFDLANAVWRGLDTATEIGPLEISCARCTSKTRGPRRATASRASAESTSRRAPGARGGGL